MSVFLLHLFQIVAEATGVFIFLPLLRCERHGEQTCVDTNVPSEVAAPEVEEKVKAAAFPNVSSAPRENRESNEL